MNPRVVLPLAALAVAAAGAAVLVTTTSPVSGRQVEKIVRSVRVVPVATRSVELEVRSQGTVAPRTESELVSEVAGRVVWTSPSLVSGGYFEAGESLLRIDRADYAAAVGRAKASLARSEGEYQHAAETLERQRNLKARAIVSEAAFDDAERTEKVTRANLREAKLALEQATRDLERTEIRAPFTGRVRDERVDVGQFVNRGEQFATLYATDAVEVRLPIADSQLAYLDLPLWARQPAPETELPEVTLFARFAGRDHEWKGRVVRTEGEIDTKSRLVHVVARVANDDSFERAPLPVGLFVQARIAGRRAEGVAVIPRQALQDGGRVLVVDSDNRLRVREVDVLRLERDEVLISSGVSEGERVSVSIVAAPVDGMTVRPVTSDPEGPGT